MKPGYKQTEIGLIPEDWEVKCLEDFGIVKSGGTPSTTCSDYWNGNIAWCTPSDITGCQGKYIADTERHITEKGLNNSAATIMPVNSVLLCTRATIGELKINSVPMATNQGFKNLQVNEQNSTNYIYYLLQTKKNRMLELAIGSTFLEISKKALCQIPLQTPSMPEQQLIANALSDIDELIFSLEKLIAKKKAVKQGAMQDLLTGKKRLPGFSGEWEMLRLEQILDYEQPINYIVGNEDYTYSGTPVLTAGKSFVLGYTNEDFGIFTDLPIILFDDFLTASRYVDFKFKVKSSAVKMLKKRRSQDNIRVIFEMMQLIDFQVVDHQRHWISQFSKLTIKLPNADEQNAIADTIANMDNEIESLEKKLAKYRNIKQGMMQQLLTGQIRLV